MKESGIIHIHFQLLIALLSDLGVKCGRHDRHKSPDDKREMQIRVYPEDFVIIGFNVAWKKRLLYDFVRANREFINTEKANSKT